MNKNYNLFGSMHTCSDIFSCAAYIRTTSLSTFLEEGEGCHSVNVTKLLAGTASRLEVVLQQPKHIRAELTFRGGSPHHAHVQEDCSTFLPNNYRCFLTVGFVDLPASKVRERPHKLWEKRSDKTHISISVFKPPILPSWLSNEASSDVEQSHIQYPSPFGRESTQGLPHATGCCHQVY